MIESGPYGDAVEQFLHLGFSHEIRRAVTNIVEHHVFGDPELSSEISVRMATVVMMELRAASKARPATMATELGKNLMERVAYWERTSRLRHGTFDGSNTVRLSPMETSKLFFTLRHIATTLIHALTQVPVYQLPLTPQ